MSDVLIEARGLGKRYYRGAFGAKTGISLPTLSRLWRRGRGRDDELWALKDIDLELREGEALGIIGPNGAGKSTLLKLLSRVTDPTEGWLRVRGRVGALIEVGAGFHPELTGRENIYINGAILGMSRREIGGKFDEIVAFAELEEFIDMPVKKYSSGMYVRLGFAVAAHMDPDILLVDEVLAVGDSSFQSRCMKQMEGYRQSGLGLILVSHNLHAIVSNCERVILLDTGEAVFEGDPVEACQTHMRNMQAKGATREEQYIPGASFGSMEVEIERVQFLDAKGNERPHFEVGEQAEVRICYINRASVPSISAEVTLHGADGEEVFSTHAAWDGGALPASKPSGVVQLNILGLYVPAGTYSVTVGLHDARATAIYHVHYKMYQLQVTSDRRTAGSAYVPHQWAVGNPAMVQEPSPPSSRT